MPENGPAMRANGSGSASSVWIFVRRLLWSQARSSPEPLPPDGRLFVHCDAFLLDRATRRPAEDFGETVTGASVAGRTRELVHGERESFIGGYRWPAPWSMLRNAHLSAARDETNQTDTPCA
jgi:hypothetical protein